MADNQLSEVADGAPVANNENNAQIEPNRHFSIWAILKTVIVRCLIVYGIVTYFKSGQKSDSSTPKSNEPRVLTTNLFQNGQVFDLYAYVSEKKYFTDFDDPKTLIWNQTGLIYGDWTSGPNFDGTYSVQKSIPITKRVQNNGTLFLHVFVVKHGKFPNSILKLEKHVFHETIYTRHQLNKYKKVRYTNTKNLLTGKTEKTSEEIRKADLIQYEVKSFWHPNLTINLITDQTNWPENSIPMPISEYIEFIPYKHVYKPILFVNTFWNLNREYSLLNESVTEVELTVTYQPISLFKWQIYASQGSDKSKWTPSFMQVLQTEDNDDDHDSLKETLLETSPYLLVLTLVVTILHSLFEVLAFKNDIQFWNNRESLEGLSVRSVFFNAFQAVIVLLYVLDNEANFMIRLSCFVGLAIELWKIRKVVDIKWDHTNKLFGIIPRMGFIDKSSYIESSTREYDRMAFRYLSWICFPLFLAYAVYSLLYDEHTGWYSFTLSLCYGFLLTFSFIMMTPQLFINYKMKSVAHLPWRMMTYKSLNTFIDDIFAFIIKMPTLHRLRCFRDDIVFFVFLYQRWIYKVDHKRINEFGVSGEMLKESQGKLEVRENQIDKKTN